MFSHVFVFQSVKLRGGDGSHVNFAHDALGYSIAVYKSISMVVEEDPPQKWWWKRTPPPEVVVEEDPCRSGSGRGPPLEVVVEEDPLPKKWQWKRTPLPPSQCKDQTRPVEKYCWASGRYALEKWLPC